MTARCTRSLCVVAVVVSLLPAAAAEAGLLAYWSLDEGINQTAADIIGDFDGTLGHGSSGGSDPAWGTGKFGNALSFSTGSGDNAALEAAYVKIGGGAKTGLDFAGATPFSISTWVKSDNKDTTHEAFFDKNDYTGKATRNK